MGRHGKEEPEPVAQLPLIVSAGVENLLRFLVFVLAAVDSVVAVALAIAAPGISPALLFLQTVLPLPVWAAAFAAAALLLLIRFASAAHVIAAFLWLAMAVGGVLGLLNGSTTSPAASLILTTLIAGMAVFHVRALTFRRRLARIRH